MGGPQYLRRRRHCPGKGKSNNSLGSGRPSPVGESHQLDVVEPCFLGPLPDLQTASRSGITPLSRWQYCLFRVPIGVNARLVWTTTSSVRELCSRLLICPSGDTTLCPDASAGPHALVNPSISRTVARKVTHGLCGVCFVIIPTERSLQSLVGYHSHFLTCKLTTY